MENIQSASGGGEAPLGPGPEPQGFWIDRQEEAKEIVESILSARSRLILLYGRHGIGKTSLIRNCVMRLVPPERGAFYGDCDGRLPSRVCSASGVEEELWTAADRGGIIFLDSFETVLDLPDGRREPLVRSLCERAASSPGVLTVVFNEDRLGRALALRAYLPEVLDAAFEIEGIGAQSGLEELRLVMDGSRLQYEPEVLAKIAAEAESAYGQHAGLAPDLLRAIDSQLQSSRKESGKTSVGLEDYKALGGLREILRNYLWSCLNSLESGRDLALSILDDVATAVRSSTAIDFRELCERTEVSEEEYQQVYSWLRRPGGLLRESEGGRLETVPAALATIVEEEVGREVAEVRRLLRQGEESWRQVGALLPPESFEAVHQKRRNLRLNREEVELMFLCALRYAEPEELGKARYWLRRFQSREAAIRLLCRLLADPSPDLRCRAAILISGFDEPEVRHELHMLALRDAVPEVRARAISSLQRMTSEDLLAFLLQEISDIRSPYRGTAVDTLRIFPSAAAAKALKEIVCDARSSRDLRLRAVVVLSELGIAEAADALVEIALLDQDPEDREEAAERLATARSEPLLRRALRRLRDISLVTGPVMPGFKAALYTVLRLATSIGLVVANFVVHGLLLVLLGWYRLGAALIVAEAISFWGLWGPEVSARPALFLTWLLGQVLPMGILLIDRRERRLKAGSLRGTLVIALFIANALSTVLLFHGLAHAAVRRWVRGAALFAAEFAGLFLTFIVVTRPEIFYITVASLPEDRLYDALRAGYFVLGAVLFAGTYLYDLLAVAGETIFYTHKHELEVRRQALYRRLMANPVAATAVLGQLEATEPLDAGWARTMVHSFGTAMPPQLLINALDREDQPARRLLKNRLIRKVGSTVPLLRAHWETGDPETKRRIVKLLARKPTEASLAALKDLWPQLSRRERARSVLSSWHFRFRVWPKTLILSVVFLLPILALFCYEGVMTLAVKARPQIKMLRNEREDPRLRIGAAEFLAKAFPDKSIKDLEYVLTKPTTAPGVRAGVVQSLTGIAAGEDLVSPDPVLQRKALDVLSSHFGAEDDPLVRDKILEGLNRVAGTSPSLIGQGQTLYVLARILNDPAQEPADRHAVLDILGAGRVAGALEDFVASSPGSEATGEVRSPAPPAWVAQNVSKRQDEAALRLEGVSALGRMTTISAYQALRKLEKTPGLSRELRNLAQREAANLTQRFREELENEQYEAVLRDATPFLEAGLPEVPEQDILLLLGRASFGLASQAAGSASVQEEFLRKAIGDLEKAREKGPLPPEAADLLAWSYIAEGGALHSAGREGDARELWQKALAADPMLPLSRRAWLLLQSGELQQGLETALSAIEQDPADSSSFQVLVEIFHKQGRELEAERTLRQLRQRYPDNILPRFHLAALYHEYLSASDPTAFEKAYQEYAELVKTQTNPHPTLLANFAEASLTSGRHQEAARIAQDLLARGQLQKPSPENPLVLDVEFINYTALALDGQLKQAGAQLEQIEQIYLDLPQSFQNTWDYAGLTRYIQGNPKLPEKHKQALQSLADLLSSRKPDSVAREVFDLNQAALLVTPP